MSNYFYYALVALCFIIGFKVGYSAEPIICTYSYEKMGYSTFNVTNDKTIHKEFSLGDVDFVVHIEDTKKFTEVDDYITIEHNSRKMTYPLECR